MTYMACVRNKTTKKIEVLTMDYPSKKAFAADIKGNGYSIRFICLPEEFDEACDKWHEACERSKAYHNAEYAAYKDGAKRMGMTIQQYKAWLKAE